MFFVKINRHAGKKSGRVPLFLPPKKTPAPSSEGAGLFRYSGNDTVIVVPFPTSLTSAISPW